ncbi:MAG: hypothetical protein U0470_02795 [Anaerolineae bacterium]
MAPAPWSDALGSFSADAIKIDANIAIVGPDSNVIEDQIDFRPGEILDFLALTDHLSLQFPWTVTMPGKTVHDVVAQQLWIANDAERHHEHAPRQAHYQPHNVYGRSSAHGIGQ